MTLRRLCATFTSLCASVSTFGPTELALHPSCVRSHHPSRNTSTSWRTSSERGYADGPDSWHVPVFDRDLRFDLGSIPYSPRRGVFVRGVTEELLWMISGSTDAGALAWG
jgi:hypothetical protein